MEGEAERRRERLRVRSPLTGEEVGDFPIMGPEELRGLVDTARAAQSEWSRRSLEERARALDRVRRLAAERADEIAGIIRAETGKVVGEALFETVVACDYLDYLTRTAPKALLARQAGSGWLSHRRARVVYEPFGVIGAITPWNYPFAISMSSVGTPVAAGNAVVLKPSEYTPGTGQIVAELYSEATGMENLVVLATGDGRTGAAPFRAPAWRSGGRRAPGSPGPNPAARRSRPPP